MLVLGVELNSEQMIESESLQPVLSSTGAIRITEKNRYCVHYSPIPKPQTNIKQTCQSFVSEYLQDPDPLIDPAT